MDWVHCNSCYKQPRKSAPGRKFLLTSCGHIYCGSCINTKPVQEKCIVCGSTYTTVHLNEELKPDVQEYFKDTRTYLKKQIEVLVFQDGHRQRLATHFKVLEDKYAAAKEEVKRMYGREAILQKRVQELENVVKFHKRKIDDMKTVTARGPGTTPGSGGKPGGVHKKVTPSPVLSGTMKLLTQKMLQTTQGKQNPRDHMWLTPDRLTLQYKPMSAMHTKPSPDSTMTPVQSSVQNFGMNFGGFRQYNPQFVSQSSPAVGLPVHSHRAHTPNSGPYYRPSAGPNMQHRNQNFYDSSVPSPLVQTNLQPSHNDQQKKK